MYLIPSKRSVAFKQAALATIFEAYVRYHTVYSSLPDRGLHSFWMYLDQENDNRCGHGTTLLLRHNTQKTINTNT